MTESENTPASPPDRFYNMLAALPCPQPLPEAVDAGLFGVSIGKCECPTADDVRAITDEQAREMVTLLAGQRYLAWCIEQGCHPETHRNPTSAARDEQLSQRLQREIDQLTEHYRWCLYAYSDAFGDEAAEVLASTVRQFVDDTLRREMPAVQRRLF